MERKQRKATRRRNWERNRKIKGDEESRWENRRGNRHRKQGEETGRGNRKWKGRVETRRRNTEREHLFAVSSSFGLDIQSSI